VVRYEVFSAIHDSGIRHLIFAALSYERTNAYARVIARKRSKEVAREIHRALSSAELFRYM
jgi:hypothetical protein